MRRDKMGSKRKCGDCRACCTALSVKEIEKPVNVPCANLCKTGCGIYATRPKSCKDYQCAWLQGVGHVLDRPDKTGVIFDAPSDPGDRIYARELWEGAADRPINAHIIRVFSHAALVFVLCRGGARRVCGPEAAIRALIERARKAGHNLVPKDNSFTSGPRRR